MSNAIAPLINSTPSTYGRITNGLLKYSAIALAYIGLCTLSGYLVGIDPLTSFAFAGFTAVLVVPIASASFFGSGFACFRLMQCLGLPKEGKHKDVATIFYYGSLFLTYYLGLLICNSLPSLHTISYVQAIKTLGITLGIGLDSVAVVSLAYTNRPLLVVLITIISTFIAIHILAGLLFKISPLSSLAFGGFTALLLGPCVALSITPTKVFTEWLLGKIIGKQNVGEIPTAISFIVGIGAIFLTYYLSYLIHNQLASLPNLSLAPAAKIAGMTLGTLGGLGTYGALICCDPEAPEEMIENPIDPAPPGEAPPGEAPEGEGAEDVSVESEASDLSDTESP